LDTGYYLSSALRAAPVGDEWLISHGEDLNGDKEEEEEEEEEEGRGVRGNAGGNPRDVRERDCLPYSV